VFKNLTTPAMRICSVIFLVSIPFIIYFYSAWHSEDFIELLMFKTYNYGQDTALDSIAAWFVIAGVIGFLGSRGRGLWFSSYEKLRDWIKSGS